MRFSYFLFSHKLIAKSPNNSQSSLGQMKGQGMTTDSELISPIIVHATITPSIPIVTITTVASTTSKAHPSIKAMVKTRVISPDLLNHTATRGNQWVLSKKWSKVCRRTRLCRTVQREKSQLNSLSIYQISPFLSLILTSYQVNRSLSLKCSQNAQRIFARMSVLSTLLIFWETLFKRAKVSMSRKNQTSWLPRSTRMMFHQGRKSQSNHHQVNQMLHTLRRMRSSQWTMRTSTSSSTRKSMTTNKMMMRSLRRTRMLMLSTVILLATSMTSSIPKMSQRHKMTKMSQIKRLKLVSPPRANSWSTPW